MMSQGYQNQHNPRHHQNQHPAQQANYHSQRPQGRRDSQQVPDMHFRRSGNGGYQSAGNGYQSGGIGHQQMRPHQHNNHPQQSHYPNNNRGSYRGQQYLQGIISSNNPDEGGFDWTKSTDSQTPSDLTKTATVQNNGDDWTKTAKYRYIDSPPPSEKIPALQTPSPKPDVSIPEQKMSTHDDTLPTQSQTDSSVFGNEDLSLETNPENMPGTDSARASPMSSTMVAPLGSENDDKAIIDDDVKIEDVDEEEDDEADDEEDDEEFEEEPSAAVASTNNSATSPAMAKIHDESITDEKAVILEQLTALRTEDRMADVIFLVGGQKYTAHKVILAMRSSVFKRFFINQNASQANLIEPFEIKNVQPVVFEAFLTFIYEGEIDAPLIEKYAFQLLFLAEKYEMESLVKLCRFYVDAELTIENACNTLIIAEKQGIVDLKNNVIDFINRNAVKVMATQGWKEMESSYPHLVIPLYQAAIARCAI